MRQAPPAAEIEKRYLELLERNQGRVIRICRAWTRDAADCDDLRAEVHLQLWRALPAFDGRSAEDTWLYRVVLNTAMLHRRREARRREQTGGARAALDEVRATGAGATERVEARERLARLRRALTELGVADRALVMLQLEGASYRRIAEITGLEESNVGVRLHRLKKRLARRLAEPEEDQDGRA